MLNVWLPVEKREGEEEEEDGMWRRKAHVLKTVSLHSSSSQFLHLHFKVNAGTTKMVLESGCFVNCLAHK